MTTCAAQVDQSFMVITRLPCQRFAPLPDDGPRA
ncbi:hypothetical protein SAMN05216197_14722 [Pseudomonas graminis]|uniref:Uncharacterized protein n=1 Tax=Pseudomonas graminis TaxID=158627 RepID=A0A1I0J6M8_9PSED|nr:hypothetical protein SAMN05216197_14722 [Pseudomonas graminis]